MAKRKKKEEEEEPDFEMPDFDREEYMRNEIKKGKTTLVAVGLAPVFSVVSFFAFSATEEWTIGLFAGLLGIVFLKPIYDYLDLDMDSVDTKGWIKNFGVYALTLLAVWIVLMNPPFGDFADPRVNELNVEIREGEVFEMEDIQEDHVIIEELNNESLPGPLADEYEEEGYPLSENISISAVDPNERWDLSDGDRGYEHAIMYENETLSIHGSELVDFEEIQYDPYGKMYDVTFSAKVTSNTEIKEDSVHIRVRELEEDMIQMIEDPEEEHYYWAAYEMRGSPEPYVIEIEMEDVNGNYHKEILEVNIPPHE